MLDLWIIEKIRRDKEKQEENNRVQPYLEIPMPEYAPKEQENKKEQTVIVIQL
jgi:hypothetical protein